MVSLNSKSFVQWRQQCQFQKNSNDHSGYYQIWSRTNMVGWRDSQASAKTISLGHFQRNFLLVRAQPFIRSVRVRLFEKLNVVKSRWNHNPYCTIPWCPWRLHVPKGCLMLMAHPPIYSLSSRSRSRRSVSSGQRFRGDDESLRPS
jgi:hypothetical protein